MSLSALWRRLVNLLRFQLEQMILRGALSRLFVIALAMGFLAVVAGMFVHYWVHGFEDPGKAVWWAFLRLTDTGYLGDDQGTLLRIVSTIMTVFGAVLFVGALIAIMTQWLNQTIEFLEQGFTPIAQNNHVLILGWTNRTPQMVAQLVQSQGRVRRFLRGHGGGPLKIVVLAERVSPALVQELKDRLGRHWDRRQITLRSGSPLRLEHLLRVDYLHAAVIVLPAREFGGGDPDEATVKTLMSAAHSDRAGGHTTLPLMVAEILNGSQLDTARRAYPGPAELIGTGLLVSRLMAQNARHRGLSRVYTELLDEGGNGIFIHEFPEFVGKPLRALAPGFERAILLGVTRRAQRDFIAVHAQPDYVLAVDDRLALLAREFDECAPRRGFKPKPVDTPAPAPRKPPKGKARRVLVLGWNQKLPSLIGEFDAYAREPVQLDCFSLIDASDRQAQLARRGINPIQAQVRHLTGDCTSRFDLLALDPAGYDSIILVTSDRLESAERADARTLLGYLVLSQLLEDAEQPPTVLVEAMSSDNTALFDAPNVELLVSPDLQSRILTHVALRRELHWVLDDLFGAGGAEIALRRAQAVATDTAVNFRNLSTQLAERGEILLGILRRSDGQSDLQLNPRDRDTALNLAPDDALVVVDVA